MARFSRARIRRYFLTADAAITTATQGAQLEELVAYLFTTIPGLRITARNEYSAFGTEEIDLACWNDRATSGLAAIEFPAILLVECKNWSKPVSSMEVAWFIMKVWGRGQRFGILIAANGITGNGNDLDRAHQLIARALSQGTSILVITREEILRLTSSLDLVRLLQKKLTQLVVHQTSLL
jgi:hypothetical protein